MEDRFIGKRLDGRYEIHDLIGVGGMSYVYRAYDRMEDRWVAVKILKEEFSRNNDFLRRFRNESKAIAVLSHPNIVRIFDVSLGDQIQYIVMEFIDGITLKEYIEQQGAIRWQETIHFIAQILSALETAHAKGIIHRDIKPQNIILLRDGSIKVTDFGIARFSQSETQTMTDKAIGSVHYISPEQARGDYITDKADVYSTGVMMYEMLTGTLPFVAENAVSVALMQLQAKPRMPHEVNPSIPRGLEQITMRAMEKNPANRFRSAGEMLDDVERFRANPSMVFSYEFTGSDYAAQRADAPDVAGYQTAHTPDYEDNYEYEEELVRSKRQRKGGMALMGILIAVIVVAIGVGAVYAINFFKEQQVEVVDEVTVPNFVGMNYQADILNNAEYGDFKFLVEEGRDLSRGPGEVIKQEPIAGKTVKKGREITLTVNPTGDPTTEVPPLVGYQQDSAVQMLELKSLKTKIEVEFSDEIPVGEVIKTDPVAGSVVAEGTTVTLYVSNGPSTKKVTVPEGLEGMSLEDAKQKILDADLTVGSVKNDDSSQLAAGTVISVTPNSGSRVNEGQSIDILVSSGKGQPKTLVETIQLPNVNEEITMKIYKDGSKEEEKQINPAYNNTYAISFTGTSGISTVVVELNGAEYLYIQFDFDQEKTTITKEYEFEGGNSSSESSDSSGSEE